MKQDDINRFGINEVEKLLFYRALNGDRFNHLWQFVVNNTNIVCAIKIVKANKGSQTPGPDGLRMKDILLLDMDTNIKEVKKRLYGRTMGKAREVKILKSNGKFRPLGIANIYDRIAQQCVRNVIEPILEAQFNQESFGFRKWRSAEECVSYIATSIQFNNDGHIYDCDLKSYFDTVIIDKVIDKLRINHNIHDIQILMCIKRLMWIDLVNPKVRYKGVGLRQGTILGPILANVMFHDFELRLNNINDHKRKHGREFISNPNIFKNFGKNYKRGREFYFNWLQSRRVVKIVRYADDFVLISKGKYDIYDAIIMFKDWCNENSLIINEDKTKLIRITPNITLNFLGFRIRKKDTRMHSFLISPIDQKAIWTETKKRLRNCIFDYDTSSIVVYLRGIFNYYGITTNMTWLISRVYLYLFKVMTRKRRYGNRIEVLREECTYFKVNGVIIDLWGLRKITVKSTANVMPRVNQLWYPDKDTNCDKKWIEDYYAYQMVNGNQNSNIIYMPSLISQYKKEPITGLPIYGYKPEEMIIHHRIPIENRGSELYSNLIPLCKESHELVHKEVLNDEDINKNIILSKLNKYRDFCKLPKYKKEKSVKILV